MNPRIERWFGVVALFTAVAGIAAPRAGAQDIAPPPPGGSEFSGFTIYTTACLTPTLQQFCIETGVRQVPLVTKTRFFDIENDKLDLVRYREKIWTPGIPTERQVCLNFPYGIPAGWPDFVDLDFEEWLPIRFPDQYPPAVVQRRFQEYKDLIQATRDMRPTAQVCMHNMLGANPLRNPETARMEAEIAALCDATSPSMYVREGYFWYDWQVDTRVLNRCLEVKKSTGLKVYPILWKRYRDTLTMMPENFQRLQVQLALEYQHQGERVDGLYIFCMMDEDELTEVAYHRMVVEVTNQVASQLEANEEDPNEDDENEAPPASIVELRNSGVGQYD